MSMLSNRYMKTNIFAYNSSAEDIKVQAGEVYNDANEPTSTRIGRILDRISEQTDISMKLKDKCSEL